MQEERCPVGISARFKALRNELKLNQGSLAERIGIGQSDISKIENGHKCPDILTMRSLVETFQISISWLLTGKGLMRMSDIEASQDQTTTAKTPEIVERAKQILTSGNPNAAAMLEMHINQLEATIKAENERDDLKRKVSRLEQERLKDKAEHKEEQSPDEKAA